MEQQILENIANSLYCINIAIWGIFIGKILKNIFEPGVQYVNIENLESILKKYFKK